MANKGTLSGYGIASGQPQQSAGTLAGSLSTPGQGVSFPVRPATNSWIVNSKGGLGGSSSFNQSSTANYVPTIFQETCQDVYIQEKHISVVRKGPTAPPTLEMFSYTRADLNANGLVDIEKEFNGADPGMMVGHFPTSGGTIIITISAFYKPNGDRKIAGDEIVLPILDIDMDWQDGDLIVISHEYVDTSGIKRKVSCRAAVTDTQNNATSLVACTLLTNTVGFPSEVDQFDLFTAKLVQGDPMFELKFPKFAYRYKFEDGEYSVFSPWSQIAFIPDEFDYFPKKGYNLGMTNRLRSLKIKDWVPKNIPKDVVQVDLLFKQSNSPNVYTVESFKQDDVNLPGKSYNHWNSPGTGANFGSYTVNSELIHATVASNQMLRPWDNVPRKALGQEITANRLVFANYVQNYNTIDNNGADIKPMFSVTATFQETQTTPDLIRLPGKSLKSMRQYQLGVVYRDRYGRETPVLTSESGTFKIKKDTAQNYNKININITSDAPDWAESFTIYVKETSNEYYNLAMDRWYDAEDGGIWVSFPSSERNKISDETILYLKKQHDSNTPVTTDEKYKVIDIKNSAPTFIKTDKQFWGGVDMMLPPAGWGTNGRPGSWQSGMFGSTGLPLQGRLFLDVYAEYAEQTILAGMKSMNRDGLQVRIVQGAGQVATAYTASTITNQNTSKSDWYDVSRISFIGEEPATYLESYTSPSTGITTEVELEEPNAKHPLIRITLEKKMGADMAFTEPNDNLDLSRGLSLEVRNSIVRDKAQFEGRFFVKLYRSNDLVRNIIQPSNPVADAVYVVESKGIKYLCDAHPGVQEWSSYVPLQARTLPTSSGDLTNYIKPGISIGRYGDPGVAIKKQVQTVSSYSAAAAGCDWRDKKGGWKFRPASNCGSGGRTNDKTTFISNFPNQQGEYPYQGANDNELGCWPFAPGPDDDTNSWTDFSLDGGGGYDTDVDGWANNSGNPSWWGNKFRPHTDSHGQTKTSSNQPYNWPSFIPSQWEPLSKKTSRNFIWYNVDDNGALLNSGDLNVGFAPEDAREEIGEGVNPYLKPAIWGRDCFVKGAWETEKFLDLRSLDPAGDRVMWTPNTISDLNRDWMGYWNTGTGSFDTQWPFVRASWDRWFIDKVGAAENYAGSGIWDDDNVSHIAISYWGIGQGDNLGNITDSHDLSYHQESELSFANSISTVGTMFRFKSDPDQTIYTITDVKVEKVYNYESFHGNWGYDDDNVPGVDQIGKVLPPYGPIQRHPRGLGGNHLFYSDLWQGDELNRTNTGRAMQNNRLRFNLVLDKKIGSGPNGFDPIYNHVAPVFNHPTLDDGTLVCNIPNWGGGVRARNIYDKTAASHVSLEKGGTPCPLGDNNDPTSTANSTTRYSMYNLASYWNSTSAAETLLDAAGGEQPENLDHAFYTNNPGAHIGLHERGLNETFIEIIEFYDGDDATKPMSNNPGVFETEPREDVGMDIYYAASPSYPVNLKRYRFDVDDEPGWYDYGLRGEEHIKVGSVAMNNGISAIVDGVEENRIWTNSSITGFVVGQTVTFESQGEGAYYGIGIDNNFVTGKISAIITDKIFEIESEVHSMQRSLGYFNCYSFGNGVESNRIRDDYNQVTIDKGVKASAPLAEGYEEERKASSFIFSGIYNSTSGVNRTNEFIQAEPITKDLNPINGSIQKLFARDTDLVTFCENKVFKVLAKKDALFNADGNKNVTSNAAVLGATIPFEGEFGISRNPESFASESYRVYFTDKDRGAVMRLSKSGLKPISDKGMKDWFKDNLMNASSLIGSFDTREDHYNLTVETKDQDGIDNAYTLSFTESKNGGWISFKSFIKQGGISYKNKYYTFPSNNFNMVSTAVGSDSKRLYGDEYGLGAGMAEAWMHHVDLDFTRVSAQEHKGVNIVFLIPSGTGLIVEGMNIEGNGVPVDTVVTAVNLNNSIALNKSVYIENAEVLRFTTARNNFYSLQSHSMVRTMFNGAQGTVKRFKTLDYEGSQGKSLANTSDNYKLHLDPNPSTTVNVGQVYTNNMAKNGWEVFEIKTDMQDGSIPEFVDKENKWFNYIRGFENAGFGDDVDTAEFSAQGLGITNI